MKAGLQTKYSKYNFEKLFKEKGYTWFTKGNYNLNIIGIRSNQNNNITNKYDDLLIVDYNTGNGHKRVFFPITTEPGSHYMNHPCHKDGAAILVPGQYRNTWAIGLHKNKYKALCQIKPVKVYRDNNRNNVYDLAPSSIETGMFGINIHRSNEYAISKNVNKYSAGCQVFSNPSDFNSFMRICEQQRKLYGNSFTYTLLDENELK